MRTGGEGALMGFLCKLQREANHVVPVNTVDDDNANHSVEEFESSWTMFQRTSLKPITLTFPNLSVSWPGGRFWHCLGLCIVVGCPLFGDLSSRCICFSHLPSPVCGDFYDVDTTLLVGPNAPWAPRALA